MKTAIITFPGSNCEDDLYYAFEKVQGFRVDRIWHKDRPDLSAYDLIALPGGFSYGDYLRCGAMASLSPVMEQVKEAAHGGTLVLGVCNGFQILCESGLLPGALARNEKQQFVCKDVYLRVESNESPWTCDMKVADTVCYPIAHGDGRYIIDESELPKLQASGQILLTYVDAQGKISPGSNPNGSSFSIAGVCNEKKNVFGLMPHPERATDLRSRDGVKLWAGVARFVKERA
jgi:phosphoribosylformylglycinamidine synthase subunit PurQ / glutaminase